MKVGFTDGMTLHPLARHLAALVLSVSIAPVLAIAAISNTITSGDTGIRIVLAEPAPGDAVIRGFLDIQLAKGWKTYWRDPGDAGVPLGFDTTASLNAGPVTVHYPLPKRFDDGITIWAGYDQPVQLPFEFSRPDPAKGSTLNVRAFLGLCEKICIPISAEFSATVENATLSGPDQAFVSSAFSALPDVADDDNRISSLTVADDTITASVALEGDEAQDLYLAAPEGWQFSAPKKISDGNGSVQFTSKVLFKPKTPIGPLIVNYTLAGRQKAVSGQITTQLP